MSRATTDDRELVVQEYLRVLKRRKWVIVVILIGAVAAALGWSFLQSPVYQSQAELILQPRSNENLFNALGDIRDPGRLAQTEMKVLQSQPVRDLVARDIGRAPAVATSQSGTTNIIQVRARDLDPERAALIANTYANAYIEFRRTRAIDDILAASEQIQGRIDQLQQEIDQLATVAGGTPDSPSNPVVSSQIAALTSQQGTFKEKLNQLEVDSALSTGGAEVVNPATPGRTPVEPTPMSDGVTAAVIGLMLGIGLSFLLEYLDDSIKTKEHLELAIGSGIPTLGLIPEIEAHDLDRTRPGQVSSGSSRPAEAFRALRTSIQFVGLERPRMLQVTSPTLGEGKTTIVTNLALVLSKAGMKVVLVDCDLRRPRVHTVFNLPVSPGFTSIVLGESTAAAALHAVNTHLQVLTSGPVPPNPSEILSHRRTSEVLDGLAGSADIVLIDSPPLLPVSDASALAGRVTGVLLVAAADRTRRRQIRRAVELLEQVHAPLVGTVLTRVSVDARERGEYSYYVAGRNGAGRRLSPKGDLQAPNSNGANKGDHTPPLGKHGGVSGGG